VRTERIPRRLAGRYELERRVREEPGFEVWLATDLVLVRPVLVELVVEELTNDPEFVDRLREDTRRFATLAHPNVVRLLDSGGEGDLRYLVRERVTGETLAERLARPDAIELDRAVEIALEILAGLEALHEIGLVHLGLFPDVVVLGPDRTVLGGAPLPGLVLATRPATEAIELLGFTGRTMPPELATGERPDERTDVFLAGSLLREMTTSRPIPRALDAEIRRATVLDREQRTASVSELLARLRPIGPRSRMAPTVSWQDAGTLARRHGRREGRSLLGTWLAIPVLVALATGLAILIGLWLGALELGGPLGVRPHTDRPSPTATEQPLTVVGAPAVVDPPPGDGTENDDLLPLATDGNTATAWKTSNYYDGVLHKAGVGLRLDLGRDRVVTGIRLWTPYPGWTFQVEVSDDPSALPAPSSRTFTSTEFDRVRFAPTTGRYVLLWITSVVPTNDGDRAEVAELQAVGHA
jgi:Protein kinase domain